MIITDGALNLALDDEQIFDFEDALQFHVAQNNGLEVIVTKNIEDFKGVEDQINILKPEEFLAQIGRTNYGDKIST
jgi:predicted nucleic acid-binding protein